MSLSLELLGVSSNSKGWFFFFCKKKEVYFFNLFFFCCCLQFQTEEYRRASCSKDHSKPVMSSGSDGTMQAVFFEGLAV